MPDEHADVRKGWGGGRRALTAARAMRSTSTEPWKAVQQSVIAKVTASIMQHPLVDSVRKAANDVTLNPEVAWTATVRYMSNPNLSRAQRGAGVSRPRQDGS